MKHIKKKYLLSHNIDKKTYNEIISNTSDIDLTNINSRRIDEYVPYIISDNNEVIQCFHYRQNNILYIIPEPNPIVIYFSNAQNFLMLLNKKRESLFESLTNPQNLNDIMNNMYDFFGFASNFVTSLFNSLEAYINFEIPNEYKYSKTTPKKTELYNKEQIQLSIPFDEKIKIVIPEIKKKCFHTEHMKEYKIIIDFKILRDKIVHTKADASNSPNYYKDLYTETLEFNYIKSIYAVKDYINFYSKNLIEKCDCGANY